MHKKNGGVLSAAFPLNLVPKTSDSSSLNFSRGNPWRLIDSWDSDKFKSGRLSGLSDLKFWVGLKDKNDTGSGFDIKTEVFKNNQVISQSLNRCITGLSKDLLLMKQISPALSPVTPIPLTNSKLTLKIYTRIGTKPDESKCTSRDKSSGLKVYFDSLFTPSGLTAVVE